MLEGVIVLSKALFVQEAEWLARKSCHAEVLRLAKGSARRVALVTERLWLCNGLHTLVGVTRRRFTSRGFHVQTLRSVL